MLIFGVFFFSFKMLCFPTEMSVFNKLRNRFKRLLFWKKQGSGWGKSCNSVGMQSQWRCELNFLCFRAALQFFFSLYDGSGLILLLIVVFSIGFFCVFLRRPEGICLLQFFVARILLFLGERCKNYANLVSFVENFDLFWVLLNFRICNVLCAFYFFIFLFFVFCLLNYVWMIKI